MASLFADTRTSSMTFPQSNATTVTQNENADFVFQAENPSAFQFEHSQKNGNTFSVAANWDRAPVAAVYSVADLTTSPFQKSDTLNFNGNYQVPLSESWTAYANGEIKVGTGQSASISDGYSTLATTGASYAVNPKLKFTIGLLTNKSLVDSVQAMPIIGIDWDITDRLKLRTLNGAFLSYELNRSTAIDLSLQYLDQSFAIENLQGTVFMRMDRPILMEETSMIGTLGVRHNWKDVFSIRAFAEITGNQEIHSPAAEEGMDVIEVPESKERLISFGVEGGIRF